MSEARRNRRRPDGRALATAILMAVLCSMGISLLSPGSADAAPPKTDILFVFDTTGSMSGALGEAATEASDLAARLRTEISDVQYGVAQVQDYPDLYGGSGDVPWQVVQPISGDAGLLASSIGGLSLGYGGDSPESYGRALYEADLDPAVGWRPGARRLVVLLADDMPHDDDLNAGIPSEIQLRGSPYSSGIDPGRDGVVGTGDDLDWQATLQKLNSDGVQLLYVFYHGVPEYLPYWQAWAAITGGGAAESGSGDLTTTIVDLVNKAVSRDLPPCPEGQARNSSGACAPIPPPPPPPSTTAVVFVSGLDSSQRFADPGTVTVCGDGGTWQQTAARTQLALGGRYKVFLAPAERNRATPDCDGVVAKTDPIMHVNTRKYADPDVNGRALLVFLGHLKRKYGITDAYLVGHSYGGIWSRSALTLLAKAPRPVVRIKGLITVGTPHSGSWGADIYSGLKLSCLFAPSIPLEVRGVACAGATAASVAFGPALDGLTSSSLTAWNRTQTDQASWGCVPVTPIAGNAVSVGPVILGKPVDYSIPHDGIVGLRSASGVDSGISWLMPRQVFGVLHVGIPFFFGFPVMTTDAQVRDAILRSLSSPPAGRARCGGSGSTSTSMSASEVHSHATTAARPPRAKPLRVPFVESAGGRRGSGAVTRPRAGEALVLVKDAVAFCGGKQLASTPLLGLDTVRVIAANACPTAPLRIRARGRGAGAMVTGVANAGVRLTFPRSGHLSLSLYGLRRGARAVVRVSLPSGRKVAAAQITSGKTTLLRLKPGRYRVTVTQTSTSRALQTTVRI